MAPNQLVVKSIVVSIVVSDPCDLLASPSIQTKGHQYIIPPFFSSAFRFANCFPKQQLLIADFKLINLSNEMTDGR